MSSKVSVWRVKVNQFFLTDGFVLVFSGETKYLRQLSVSLLVDPDTDRQTDRQVDRRQVYHDHMLFNPQHQRRQRRK